MKFIDEIKARAKQDVKTIVLPESRDKRTLIAAAQVLKEGTAKIVMVGDEEKIRDGAHWLDVELDGISVVNPETSPKLDEYVNLHCTSFVRKREMDIRICKRTAFK